MEITLRLIRSMEDLQPYLASYARLVGEYFVWNIQSRYEFNPQLFERNASRRDTSLDKLLKPNEWMMKHGKFSPEFAKRKKRNFANGEWLVLAIIDDKVRGMSRLTYRSEKEAELHSVYVTPEFRGRNLGRKILKELHRVAMDVEFEVIYLETMPFMQAAQQLYRSMGYQYVEYIDFGYHSREVAEEIGAVYMQKILR